MTEVTDTPSTSPTSVSVDGEVPQKRRSAARWIAAVVVLVVAILIAVLATRPAANTEIAASPLIGQPAPSVKGTSLSNQPFDLSQMRGRYVVVNFFATWCVPCRNEHPEIKAFTERNTGPNDPLVVAVAFDKTEISSVKSFFAQHGGSWPVLPDNSGRISLDYGVRGLPESYIIDPQGNVSARVAGEISAAKLAELTKTS